MEKDYKYSGSILAIAVAVLLLILVLMSVPVSAFSIEPNVNFDISEKIVGADFGDPRPVVHIPVSLPEAEPQELLEGEDLYISYVYDICELYPFVDPELVRAVIFVESRYVPTVESGGCVGLMQISTYWHANRADRLGVTDFYDPYSNILLGVDLLDELLDISNGDEGYALMLYNMDNSKARELHNQGLLSDYAKIVLAKRLELEGEMQNATKEERKF